MKSRQGDSNVTDGNPMIKVEPRNRSIFYGHSVLHSKSRGRAIRTGLALVILLAGLALVMGPYLWMLSTSLKPDRQVFVRPPIWIPNPVQWQNYPEAWAWGNLGPASINTLTIALSVLLGTLLSSSLVAYGFARLRAPGRDLIFTILLATMMLPGVVTMIPVFLIFSKLGWVNTYRPLIVPAYFGSAFNIFLLRQFFLTIPIELEDAAIIDGAGRLRIWATIFLPLSKPALATIAIFSFMGSWNDFMGPLIYLTDTSKYTIALAMSRFLQQHGAEWTLLMAASVMTTLPLVIIFFLAQRTFIQGIVTTGLAGR
jgi:ABC-type glycerol-3-phosphate transport system permease component